MDMNSRRDAYHQALGGKSTAMAHKCSADVIPFRETDGSPSWRGICRHCGATALVGTAPHSMQPSAPPPTPLAQTAAVEGKCTKCRKSTVLSVTPQGAPAFNWCRSCGWIQSVSDVPDKPKTIEPAAQAEVPA
jgi:hypothetical protein